MALTLREHGHERAHLLGHSMGSAFVSYVARHDPALVASVGYLDPICLGMHDARVTRAFMYTPADSIRHETDNYSFKNELFTSAVVARHLWWYRAAAWPQEAKASVPTFIGLSEDDDIVPTAAVSAAWEGLSPERGVHVHSMRGIGHGGWLFDDAAMSGLVRATVRAAGLPLRA